MMKSSAASSPPATIPQQGETAVCCGCRPQRRRHGRKPKSAKSARRGSTESSQFVDVVHHDDPIWEQESNDSQYFFDAVQEPLKEGEYPVVFYNYLKHKPDVSFADPESLLRPSDKKKNGIRHAESGPLERRPSNRMLTILRRGTLEHKQALESPRIRIPISGYPGELTIEELAQCQKFVREMKTRDEGVTEQVYSLRDVEEEAYTICRWLRATKFDADKILARLEENKGMFLEAQAEKFYPDISKSLGAPYSVFLSQYPFLTIGNGKNGCPVNYFHAGGINPEGIMCLTTVEKIASYFWYSYTYQFQGVLKRAIAANPDFVRCEGINIIDLQGLTASQLSSETMAVIQLSSKIADFYPETLHCMLVLNAPSFFTMSWIVIKKFVDARTARRIKVFSSGPKGLQALKDLIDLNEIPPDYGGTGQSIAEALLEQGSDPNVKRQNVQLLHIKKKNHSASCSIELAAGEAVVVRVYTRSVSEASFTVKRNGEVIKAEVVAKPHLVTGAPPTSNCTLLTKVKGPGTIVIEGIDLDTVSKAQIGLSRGYFLVVGDVM